MSETYITVNYFRILRFILIVQFVVISVLSVIQLVVDIVSLNHPVNSIFAYHNKGSTVTSSAVIQLIISILSLFSTILGAIGIRKQSFPIVLTYAIILLIIFLTSFVTSIACLAFINGDIEQSLVSQYESYFRQTSNEVSDYFQTYFKCCGLKSKNDWNGYLDRNDMVPYSCCIEPNSCSGYIVTASLWENNCLNEMKIYLQGNVNINAGLLFGYSIIVLISSIISFVFVSFMRKEKFCQENEAN
jgi:hypothetical protein